MERWKTKVAVCLLAVLLAGHISPCGAVEAKRRPRRLFWLSVALVVAASAMDVASSRGWMETNPLLRGRDGTFNTRRAVLLKSAAVGGMLATEALVLRKSPGSARGAAAVNLVTAGTIGGLAIRNWRIQAQPASQ